jgi:biotin transporter BioY
LRLVARGAVAKESFPRLRRKSLVGQIVLTILGIQLMFLAAFTSFELPVGTQRNFVNFIENQARYALRAVPDRYQDKVERYFPMVQEASKPVRKANYCPIVVAAMFCGYVLGWQLAAIACLGFLLIGLIGPLVGIHPFAAGGGLTYYNEPGFGYLLALVPASAVIGYLTQKRRTSLKQFCGTLAGLIVVHLSGLTYLMGSCLVSFLLDGTRANLVWQPWAFELARNMSWNVLPYDIALSLLVVGAAFPFRWLANTLTAPDSISSNKNGRQEQLQSTLEEALPPQGARPVPGMTASQVRSLPPQGRPEPGRRSVPVPGGRMEESQSGRPVYGQSPTYGALDRSYPPTTPARGSGNSNANNNTNDPRRKRSRGRSGNLENSGMHIVDDYR